VHQVVPEIPDYLRSDSYKASVQVKVEIAADGSAHPSLRTSSGNTDVDERVLAALRHWRWKPALKDGQAVSSVRKFRFDFRVR
jgi:protein TonB